MIENARGSMDEAITSVLNIVCEAEHAAAGTFWFYSRFGDGLIRPRARYGGSEIGNLFLNPGEGIAGQVIESGKTVIVSDCQADPRWAAKVDSKTGFVTQSMVCVPLIINDGPFGCIQLINKTDETLFDNTDKAFVERMAEEISAQFVALNILEDGRIADNVAVLFSDIHGFTSFSDRTSPATAARFPNCYLSYITRYIKQSGGTVNKTAGGQAMAYWTKVEGQPAPSYLACKAAAEIMAGVKELQALTVKEFGRKITFGIGINCGPAFIGNVGTSVLSDHTVIGKTVNDAARIADITPAEKICVGKSGADALDGKGKFTRVSSLSSAKIKAGVFTLKSLD